MSKEYHSRVWVDPETDVVYVKVTMNAISEDKEQPYAYKKSLLFKVTEEMMTYSPEGGKVDGKFLPSSSIEKSTYKGSSPHLDEVWKKKEETRDARNRKRSNEYKKKQYKSKKGN